MKNYCEYWFNTLRHQYPKNSYCDSRVDALLYGDKGKDTIESRLWGTFSDNIREYQRKRLFNRFSLMGRLSKYNLYEFVYDGTNFKVHKKPFDMRNVNLKTLIKECRNKHHLEVGLPLPINSVSRVIGVYKGKKQRIRYDNSYEPNYGVKNIIDLCDNNYSRSREETIQYVFPGSWAHNSQNLIDMATESPDHYSYSEIIDGYLSRSNVDLVIPKVPMINIDSIITLGVNPKAHSGVNTSMLISNKRNTSTKFTKPIALDYAKFIMKKKGQYVLDTSLLRVGGREKRIKVRFGVEKLLKTRVTIGQEDVPTLIGQCVAKHFNEALQVLDEGYNFGGRVNGRSNYQNLIRDLRVKDDLKEIQFNADFSGHDNNVTEQQIVAAFSLIRMSFPESKEIDRIFYYIMSGMIFKRIVLPESNLIYEITKGICTGHAFTSIINTMCSYGTFATSINKCCTKHEINKYSRLYVAGDDIIGKLPLEKILFISKHLLTDSGMKMDDVLLTSSNMECMDNNTINTFLKKKFNYFSISWNQNELFDNLVTPTSNKMSFKEKLYNYKVMATMAPGDVHLNCIIEKLIIFEILEFFSDPPDKGIKKGYFNESPIAVYIKKYGCSHKTILDNLVFPDCSVYIGEYDCRVKYDIYNFTKDFIAQYWADILKSQTWMVTYRTFKSVETLVRLKIFDLNKVETKAYHMPYVTVIFNNVYRFIYNPQYRYSDLVKVNNAIRNHKFFLGAKNTY